MDEKFFKNAQRKAGVTAADIAAELGRDRSVVSHIYTGRQRMSMDWAQAFAKVLQLPLSEVMRHAGIVDPAQAQRIDADFAGSDLMQIRAGDPDHSTARATAQTLTADATGLEIYQIISKSMMLAGYMPGDTVVADPAQASRATAGDIVTAKITDWASGAAQTVIRRFEAPVLIAASPDPDDHRAVIVDGKSAVVTGRVVASFRAN